MLTAESVKNYIGNFHLLSQSALMFIGIENSDIFQVKLTLQVKPCGKQRESLKSCEVPKSVYEVLILNSQSKNLHLKPKQIKVTTSRKDKRTRMQMQSDLVQLELVATITDFKGSAYLVSMLSVMKCKKSHLTFLKVEITQPRTAEFFHKRLCFVTQIIFLGDLNIVKSK